MNVEPDSGQATYLLVYNPPADPDDAYGLGWTLAGYRHGTRCWSVNLAARGASAHAGPRVAQAVAVRVLAGQGVATYGWHGADEQDGAFRAVLDPVPAQRSRPRRGRIGHLTAAARARRLDDW